MKAKLTLFAFLFALTHLFGNLLRAQSTYYPFPDSLADWGTLTFYFDPPNNYYSSANNFRLLGDTLLGGQAYKILWRGTNDPDYQPGNRIFCGGIREDSTRKVWYYPYNDSTEHLLYDFALEVGDTFKVPALNIPATGIDLAYYGQSGDSLISVPYQIDSVQMMDGSWHKRWQMSTNYTADQIWIEGMGSDMGPLGSQAWEFEWTTDITCFEDRGVKLYGNPTVPPGPAPCFAVVGTEDALSEGVVLHIWPNPVEDQAYMEVSGISERGRLVIMDLLGRPCHQSELRPGVSGRISCPALPPGIYLFTFESGDIRRTKRVVFH